MPKGGYKIIDCGGINVVGSNTAIPGIYDAVESANGKPLLFSNLVIEGIEINAFFSVATHGGATYFYVPFQFIAGGLVNYLGVKSNDVVIVNKYVPSTAAANLSDEEPTASM